MTEHRPQQQDAAPAAQDETAAAEEADLDQGEFDQGENAAVDETLAALETELAETKDRLLRSLAETENLRRRAAREAEEARKYAITGFARELLEVSDNLGRALESVSEEARGNEQLKPLVEGVELTQRTLASCFQHNRITKVAPKAGDKFDHNLHQAMFEVETDEYEPGSVIQVMQPGYMIAERLLRPAMVGVAKKPSASVETVAGHDQTDGHDQDAEPRGRRLNTSA